MSKVNWLVLSEDVRALLGNQALWTWVRADDTNVGVYDKNGFIGWWWVRSTAPYRWTFEKREAK